MRDDPWFSGFVDGEGCFIIRVVNHRKPSGNRTYYQPSFVIKLRDDDDQILHEIQLNFGGKLRHIRPTKSSTPGARPQIEWSVVAQGELLALIAYFDQFPLRSKKARDYGFWREATIIVATKPSGSRSSRIPKLKHQMEAGRRYESNSNGTQEIELTFLPMFPSID